MASVRGRGKIRPPRRSMIDSSGKELDFEEAWNVLSTALRAMHTKNASKLSFEVIYRHAYKMVLRRKGAEFYGRVQEFEKSWLSNDVRTALLSTLSPSMYGKAPVNGSVAMSHERRAAGERFLRALKDAFEDHQLVMNMATDVFMYLNRTYCVDNRKPSVYTAAMMHFRDCILKYKATPSLPNTLQIFNQIMLEQIGMDRAGETIDKSLMKSCVNVLEGLHESPGEKEDERLYITSFEDLFLESSRQFYGEEAGRMLREADAASYCRHTLRRIREETDRCQTTLSDGTTPKVIAVLEDELIKNKLRELITAESGAKAMIENQQFADLNLLYSLNSRVDPKKKELTQAIQRGVQELGSRINDTATNASLPQAAQGDQDGVDSKQKAGTERTASVQTTAALQWVEALLKLKTQYDQLWEQSLESDPVIQPALTRSLTESVNMFFRSSEYVSLFIDENMKKGLKDKTEEEVDRVLENAITLLRYLQDKDMFERYYKKHLCKRLLMQKSLSIENEREMIRKMKVELGNSFVSKLENMFKDMQLSEELSSAYRNRVAASATKESGRRTELSVNVLTSMTWPLEAMQPSSDEGESRSEVIYPPSIQRVKQGFENFYGERHQGRQLTWLPQMGTADIRATFPKVPGESGPLGRERRHELNVSTYGMLVLQLFNDLASDQTLTFDEIQSRTNIPTPELIRNLQSLAVAPKTRILLKEPMSKDVKPTDRFRYNERFTSQFLRIKVGVVAQGNNKVEGEKDRRETVRKNNDSRGFSIEAAVVRIMKQRKELTHQRLVAETLSQLSAQFKPDVSMIKQRIESLIEREYLERTEDTTTPAYRYLA